jgi:iron complex transport system ATP-binding protein
MTAALTYRAPAISLGGRAVLRDVAFQATPGEFVAIAGPNGAGKTTLLKGLAGLLPGCHPDPGRTAYVPQGASCAWPMTIREVAGLGRILRPGDSTGAVDKALASCGLLDLATRRIDQVSGGQARRAMLARALAAEPSILLLDEPVADLDPAAALDVMRLLATFAAGGGLVVAVLHALELATQFATRLVVLAEGRIIADGPVAQALPAAAHAFGMAVSPNPQPLLVPPPPG